MLSWPALEQSLKAAVVHPPGPPRPIHPSCLMQPAPPLATPAHTLLTDCTTLPLTPLSLSLRLPNTLVRSCSNRTRAPVRRCRRPPHLCRTCSSSAVLAARQLQTSADPLAPPAVEKSGLGLASCMQLQAQLLQHSRRLLHPCLLVETRCYLSACLPYGGIAEAGEGRAGSVR